jgi:hypothetical protein
VKNASVKLHVQHISVMNWQKPNHGLHRISGAQDAWNATAQAVIAEYVKRHFEPQPTVIQSRIHDQDIVGTIMGDIGPQWKHLFASTSELPSHSHNMAFLNAEETKPAAEEPKKQIDWLAINRSCV